jgi:hypothetical protein
MKSSITFIFRSSTFFFLFLLLCTAATAQNEQEVVLNLEQMNKFIDGRATTENLSQRTDIAAIGIKDANNAYYFTSDAAFESWASNLEGGLAVAKRNKALNNIYNYVVSHGYLGLEEGAALPRDLEEYVSAQLPGISTQSSNQAESGVFFVKYYDSPLLTGASKFCPSGFWPNLGSFRNRADSAAGAGGGLVSFCDHKWFGGQKVHVFFIAYFSVQNFGGMNNRIESHIKL